MNQSIDLMGSAQLLKNYINSLDNFSVMNNQMGNYKHMGAILTDTVLQAGLNYRTVVEPRVRRVLNNYPEAKITSVFLKTINQFGANSILNWKHPEKPRRLLDVTSLLCSCGVETEDDLKYWLVEPINAQTLRMIKGIGPKTVDYLKNLVDLPSVAVDRHIKNFVKNAGIYCDGYEDIRSIVISAASLLELSPDELDHAIWLFMSTSRQ